MIPREEIRKVVMINYFIMNEMIDVITTWLDGKLEKVLVNLVQISTHNPLQVHFNTHLFCYFFQVGIHLNKQSKRPYIDSKLL
jgi:hypothetical protein